MVSLGSFLLSRTFHLPARRSTLGRTSWTGERLLDKGNVLGSVGSVDTLNLDEAGGGGKGVARALVAQVTSPGCWLVSLLLP